jgi:hypothetical protein
VSQSREGLQARGSSGLECGPEVECELGVRGAAKRSGVRLGKEVGSCWSRGSWRYKWCGHTSNDTTRQ